MNAPVYGALDRAPSGPGLTSGSVLPAPRSAGPDEDSASGDPATYIYDGSAAGLDQTGPQVITVGNYDLPSGDWVASGALSAAGSP